MNSRKLKSKSKTKDSSQESFFLQKKGLFGKCKFCGEEAKSWSLYCGNCKNYKLEA
jgi:hypothetical protein